MISEFLEKLLVKRGLHTEGDRVKFLEPKYADLHDPLLMHDMDKAVARIFKAMEANERICIYSDYDADGIPGAVILHDFFKKIKYENFCNYIPHRHTEGYGLHVPAIDKMHAEGATLMITVDLGITAVAEVAHANGLGLDVIVTDHHEPLDVLPAAFAIVNPKLGSYPDRMLCGAGVAFKLVQALLAPSPAKGRVGVGSENPDTNPSASMTRQLPLAGERIAAIPPGWEKWLLDMAGLATLSDMVPLQNENRIIAYYGMKVLQKTQRPGLVSLFERSGISFDHMIEDDIVFSITPKLNAASRMSHPEDAFKTLSTSDRREGMVAAEHLTKLNDDRKKIVSKIMKDVHKKVLARKSGGDLKSILVIGDPSWPAGILGIIASKVLEEYHITTFVWGAEEDSIKGSCRGIGDVSAVKLMQSVSHLLTQFGGHEDAGGFTTTREHIHFMEDAMHAAYDGAKHAESKEVVGINHDMDLLLSDVTMDHYRDLRKLAPFGMANPKPIFAFKNILVESVKQFGKTTEHLEVVFKKNDRETIRAISWYANPESFTEKIEAGKAITLLGEFDHSVFRGKHELRLKIVDVIL